MMNIPVSPMEPTAPVMQCADAQAWFAAVVDGRVALTERALVEAHLRRCPECRHEEARLQQRVAQRPIRPMVAAAGLWAHRIASRMQAAHLAVARSLVGIAGLRFRAVLLLTASGRALAAATEAVRLAAGSVKSAAIRSRPSVQATAAVLALALFALSRSNGPQLNSGPAVPAFQSPGTTQLWALLAARVWSTPVVPPSRPVPIPEAVREMSFRTAPAHRPGGASSRVIGQLATTSRKAAEPHFTALLGRVSGTELGRRHRPTFTAVEVIVPRARYQDFVHGLARIGSWRLDAARFPLPDAVHMTIRVRE